MGNDYTADSWEYRKLSAKHLAVAKMISKNDGPYVPSYYALEIRRSLEAYAYSVMCAYLDQISYSGKNLWQPHAIMRMIRDIDPCGDGDIQLRFERQDGEFDDFGVDARIGYRWISDVYNKISSVIHVPTIRKVRDPTKTPDEIRSLCDSVAEEIDRALSSESYNFIIGEFFSYRCRCGFEGRKNIDSISHGEKFSCPSCSRVFRVFHDLNARFLVDPVIHKFSCKFCDADNAIQEKEDRESFIVKCRNCGEPTMFYKAWAYCQAKSAGTVKDEGFPTAVSPEEI